MSDPTPPIIFGSTHVYISSGGVRVSVVVHRDLKFGNYIRSDWPQMGQIWDFLKSVSVHFGSPRGLFKISFSTFWLGQNVLKLMLKTPRSVPFVANLPNLWLTSKLQLVIRLSTLLNILIDGLVINDGVLDSQDQKHGEKSVLSGQTYTILHEFIEKYIQTDCFEYFDRWFSSK